MDQQPNINGTIYSWGQIALRALGLIFTGVSAIKYEDDQEMELVYGAGNMPIGTGTGKYVPKASITLQMEELEVLQAAAPEGRIQKIPPFDVTVTYLRDDGITVFHTIKNCRLKTNGRDVKAGDMKIEKEIDLFPTHILWK
jgi:hypothetical protein